MTTGGKTSGNRKMPSRRSRAQNFTRAIFQPAKVPAKNVKVNAAPAILNDNQSGCQLKISNARHTPESETAH